VANEKRPNQDTLLPFEKRPNIAKKEDTTLLNIMPKRYTFTAPLETRVERVSSWVDALDGWLLGPKERRPVKTELYVRARERGCVTDIELRVLVGRS